MAVYPKPVFIFASSWRSGSTLLQRYVTRTGKILVWGETGGALNAICAALAGWEQITADPSRVFPNKRGGGGGEAYLKFIDTPKSEHPRQWIANLTPPYEEIVQGMRAMMTDLYGRHAHERGYDRFGIKETRCDLATATCLQAVFPDAKFLFLVRNPYDVMLSIKRRDWMGRQPGHDTLRMHAMHWKNLSAQFRQAGFGMTVRYEDFISDPAVPERVLDYLEIEARPPTDFIQKSQVDWKAHHHAPLSLWERARMRYWLSDEMKQWGY